MRKKDFRHLHGNLAAIAEYAEQELDIDIEYEAYEDAELDTYMNFQSLKEEEREAVEALLSDLVAALEAARDDEADGEADQNVEAEEATIKWQE